MALDLLFKFSVTDKISTTENRELYDFLLEENEEVLLAYSHRRDKAIFTDRKLIAIDVQGMTGSKKEYRCIPYTKISSYSVESAGTFDSDSDFKVWVSGVGVFEIKFLRSIKIKEVGSLLSQKVK